MVPGRENKLHNSATCETLVECFVSLSVLNRSLLTGVEYLQLFLIHTSKKHPEITNDIIVDLVRMLAETESEAVAVEGVYEYFASALKLNGRGYRLIWLLEKGKVYIGVISSYRDRRIK